MNCWIKRRFLMAVFGGPHHSGMGHARHLRCRKKGACDWGPWPRKRFARIRLNLHYCSRSGVPEGVSVDGGDGGEGQALGKHLEEGAIYVAESRGHSDPGLLAGLARLEREKQLARTRYARKKAMKKCAKPWAGNPPPPTATPLHALHFPPILLPAPPAAVGIPFTHDHARRHPTSRHPYHQIFRTLLTVDCVNSVDVTNTTFSMITA